MQVKVAYGNESGSTATMTVEPDATAIDILNGLKEANAFGVDPSKERYVVRVAKTGKNLPPNETLQAAEVQESDLLTVFSSEQGY